MMPAFVGVEASADLPCEEAEFEPGEIPEPKTLQEFESREFAFGNTSFSSFAYLVGAEASTNVIQIVDSIFDGRLLLLPKGCKQVMSRSREVDELMFQAHLVIHVPRSIINLHRPLSDLKFNPVEEVSTCARDPPLDIPVQELVDVHTVRVLRSVEAQIRLLALPARLFSHTPFVTCMVTEGTLVLLSACNFLLQGRELAITRHQIRMIIGCLGTLGELWTRIARNLQEIQMIARQVLGLAPKGAAAETPTSAEAPSLSSSEAGVLSGTEGRLSSHGVYSTTDDFYGWRNVGNLDSELSRWMGG
ncbi:hypothetical protein AK830_g5396 [Neonectria ditissima]|uniref:Transcription factor domain-containing protein n=1 Tax=Neonectria ditissima TaxID=78410 RepID=A0A0N8H798_9HYPO|nr:hypothetical protein AK830_g5396 [Neonectria ditissima]